MSASSNQFEIYEPARKEKSEEQRERRSSLGNYKIGQGRRAQTSEKWSNDRVLNELSSFIAEFSYLDEEDSPRATSKVQIKETPVEIYQVYPANTPINDEAFVNLTNPTPYKSKHDRKTHKSRKQMVGWKNHRKDSPEYERKRYSERDLTDTPHTISVEEEPERTKRNKELRSERPEQHSTVSTSRGRRSSIRKLKSRSRSKSRRNKEQISKRNKSRDSCEPRSRTRNIVYSSRQRPRTRESKVQYRQKTRSPTPGSKVKYMPFYAERRKSKPKHRRIHKTKKIEIKKLVPRDIPSIITLYPKNPPILKERHIYKRDSGFFNDPSLPCKCFNCMKKYKSLQNESPDYCRLRRVQPQTCRRIEHPCEARDDYCCGVGVFPNIHPFADDYYSEPYCDLDYNPEPGINGCVNSCYIRFNSIAHHIDSTITQYFHSILKDSIYC